MCGGSGEEGKDDYCDGVVVFSDDDPTNTDEPSSPRYTAFTVKVISSKYVVN
jgi:hypothetical protein